MFPLTFTVTINNPADLLRLSSILAGASQPDTAAPPAQAASAPRGRVKPEIREPAPEPAPEVAPEKAPEPAAPQAAAEAASQPAPERAEVSAAIVRLATRDKARALEILGQFGVTRGKDLKDEDLAQCYALVKAALEG